MTPEQRTPFSDSPQVAGVNEWAAWVAMKMDEIHREPRHALEIADSVKHEALHHASRPPTHSFLLFVQFQHDMNGKTWPRAWALVTLLKVRSWYYRRLAHR